MNGYPRLYIGKAAQELKKRVSFPVYSITKENIVEMISFYSTIPKLNNPLVLEDITYLSLNEQGMLLKFIEDSQLKIILLASEDNVIPTILSRMSLVYKIKDKITSLFLSYKQGKEELDSIDKDTFYLDYIKKQRMVSPISFYYDNYIGNKRNKDKLLQLISE